MPVDVIRDVPASQLRKGDRVVTESTEPGVVVVTEKVVKVKWTTLTFDDGTSRLVRNEHPMRVKRSELTESERTLRDYDHAVKWLTDTAKACGVRDAGRPTGRDHAAISRA